jgi:hypothetical protein
MREVRGVQARLDPSAHAICYTKCSGMCVSYLAVEEGILSTLCTIAPLYRMLARLEICNGRLAGVVRWVRKQVRLCIEPILLSRVGCSNMIRELGGTAPVVRGCVQSS